MRAGKRVDIFPNSYSGDPLAAYRLNIAKAGWPSWNYLDSGPEAMLAPPLDPEESEDDADEVDEDSSADIDGDSEADEEAAASH